MCALTGMSASACSPSGAPAESPTASSLTTPDPSVEPTGTSRASGVLLAYFSRPGENYYYGGRTNLEVGNTEVLAGMIRDLVACEVHRIEPVDPYAAGYDATVERNVREQNTDARPAIRTPLASIGSYDTVLLGSPIWNVRTPMIISTFAESHDFNGKRILPFVTYAVSGLGGAVRDYTLSCPGAEIGEALAVRGEEVPQHRADTEAWLRRAGLIR